MASTVPQESVSAAAFGDEFAPKILHLSVNHDGLSFAVALQNGYRVYAVEPLKELYRQEYDDGGGIGKIELLHRTNIVALVGGGDRPRFPANKVMLFDEKASRLVVELEFRSPVLGLRASNERLVVVLKNRVFVYSITNDVGVERLMVFDTYDNEHGVAATSRHTLAFPGKQKGHVQVVDIGDGRRLSTIIPAHNHAVCALALDPAGERIASASDKGTLIRVYDIDSGRKLHELRRGADQAEIYSIAFSTGDGGARLAVSSDKGTIHIFTLGTVLNSEAAHAVELPVGTELKNRRSSLKFMKDLLPRYFSSEWSPAHARIAESRAIASFIAAPSSTGGASSGNETVTNHATSFVVLSYDGTFYRFVYDPQRGGPCVADVATKFLQLGSFTPPQQQQV